MTNDLALLGGEPMVPAGTVKPWPYVTDEDRRAVAAVLSGGNLAEQRQIQSERLSEEFAQFVGVKHCVPTNSGTAALHMSVAALGIQPGDEVILPAFTFWASAAAILHHNAVPVFVDITPGTWCIDPSEIESKITPRTKAIMPVHIHGLPADMTPIREIAARHSLALIEDVAQAHGAQYDGHQCGSLGDVAGFSTQMSKVLTTGSEGGLFVTDDDDYAERATLLQYFGEVVVPGTERHSQEYNASGVGWMYRGDVFGQAFVRSQLTRLDRLNAARIENCELLTDLLKDVPGVRTPEVPVGRKHVFWNYVLGLYPEELSVDMPAATFRDSVQAALIAEGVDVGQWQRVPVPGQAVFQRKQAYGRGCPWKCWDSSVEYRVDDYPVSVEYLARHTYVFDIHPPNGSDVIELYARAVEKVMTNAKLLEGIDANVSDKYLVQALAAREPDVAHAVTRAGAPDDS